MTQVKSETKADRISIEKFVQTAKTSNQDKIEVKETLQVIQPSKEPIA